MQMFTCAICLEDRYTSQHRARAIGGDLICPDCAPEIAKQFEDAIKHEFNYPPKWGEQLINFEDFADLLSPQMRQLWYAKVQEYETPLQDRVYCRHQVGANSGYGAGNGPVVVEFCNRFLGEVRPGVRDQCGRCFNLTCLGCRAPVWPLMLHYHRCGGQVEEEEEEVLNEDTRGREWQRCPNESCLAAVELKDGCNHMDCNFCGTSFCFVCGDEAWPGQGHWPDLCPLYRHPNGNDGEFDGADDEDDDEDDEDDFDDDQEGDDLMAEDCNDIYEVFSVFQGELRSRMLTQREIPQELIDFAELIGFLDGNINWVNRNREFDGPLDTPAWEVQMWANFKGQDDRLRADFERTYAAALRSSHPTSILFEIDLHGAWDRYVWTYRTEGLIKGSQLDGELQ